MSLHRINSGGIECYCSNLIVNQESEIYFLSIAGYQNAVKGIIANVLEYGSVTVIVDHEYHYLSRSSESFTVHYQKLPSGLFQGVIIPRIGFPEKTDSPFFVLVHDDFMVETMLFRHLDYRLELPLHSSWSQWLWDVFKDNDWLIPLETLAGSYKGYLIDGDPDALKGFITSAIVNHQPAVIRCFQKGDKDGNQFEKISR